MAKKSATPEVDENLEGEEDQDNADAKTQDSDDGKPADSDDSKDTELARLKAENEDLKKRQVSTPAPQTTSSSSVKITAADLRNLGDEDWKHLEEKFGRTRSEILTQVEAQESNRRSLDLDARLKVADALDELTEKDPQFNKFKSYLKEYLADVPMEDKLDPAKLQRHMDKAKVYARGKAAEKGGFVPSKSDSSGNGSGQRGNKGPSPTPDADDDDSDTEGEVKPNQTVEIGKLKLKIGDLPEKLKARAKEIRHEDDPNGVQFKNFDKAPIFKR